MYRYTVDNAITYTSEDFVLFREAPFACWMERLTLENPDHGIPPDVDSQPPGNSMERQDDIADTLRTEGRNVVLVDWDMEEARRRSVTLDAMRQGADFIVNGQLALGPLSGSANLLMRTSGYSELGSYLYVPCDTQGRNSLHSAFRLCFLADLLHSLQGQLPPQMLIIRGGSDVMPLETEDHIYHYRAVKQRFMNAMREFRKHRMPDPAESSHFGRWSDCAHEVLKQRALNGDDPLSEEQFAPEQESIALQATAAEGAAVFAGAVESPVVAEEQHRPFTPASVAADARRAGEVQVRSDAGNTLAQQASMLAPAAFQQKSPAAVPGHTPNLAPVMAATAESGGRRVGDRVIERDSAPGGDLDVALENLEFIGSSLRGPDFSEPLEATPEPETAGEATESLSIPAGEAGAAEAAVNFSFPDQGESLDSPAPDQQEVLGATPYLGDTDAPIELPATSRLATHPLDSVDATTVDGNASVVDMDAGSPATPCMTEKSEDEEAATFSSSLITNDRFRD